MRVRNARQTDTDRDGEREGGWEGRDRAREAAKGVFLLGIIERSGLQISSRIMGSHQLNGLLHRTRAGRGRERERDGPPALMRL